MAKLQLNSYGDIFRDLNYLLFWSGFTLSSIGDSLTRVALTWLVFEETQSAQALGLLTIAYTAPILLGGLVAGPLLDRFSARRVMIVDNLMRGAAFSLIPILYALERLELWHIYAIAAVYGFLMMISLAGGPTLIPSIVKKEQLDTANALETLSYTVSNVIGPPLAGLLIVWLGKANVIIFDAISYFVFAIALFGVKVNEPEHDPAGQIKTSYGIMDAVRLMVGNKIILSTTLMFMAANVGLGAMTVFLPFISNQISENNSRIFGVLLGAMALGEVLSAWLTGSISMKVALGARIAFAQILSGLSLALLFMGSTFWAVTLGLFLLGFFSAPLTIWAQTLRMQVIPPDLRGRTFALLRTLMQGATPLGGALAGFLIPVISVQFVIGLSAFVIGAPGLAGIRIRELMQAGRD
ncbi:MAG TPA: MFS transporter [Anaerolineales bacterium]|nr:MFS transporter [Anaerolineales bacterium]